MGVDSYSRYMIYNMQQQEHEMSNDPVKAAIDFNKLYNKLRNEGHGADEVQRAIRVAREESGISHPGLMESCVRDLLAVHAKTQSAKPEVSLDGTIRRVHITQSEARQGEDKRQEEDRVRRYESAKSNLAMLTRYTLKLCDMQGEITSIAGSTRSIPGVVDDVVGECRATIHGAFAKLGNLLSLAIHLETDVVKTHEARLREMEKRKAENDEREKAIAAGLGVRNAFVMDFADNGDTVIVTGQFDESARPRMEALAKAVREHAKTLPRLAHPSLKPPGPLTQDVVKHLLRMLSGEYSVGYAIKTMLENTPPALLAQGWAYWNAAAERGVLTVEEETLIREAIRAWEASNAAK